MRIIKTLLPYSGIVVLGAALLAVRGGRIELSGLLLCELIIVFGYIAAVSDYKTKKIPNSIVTAMLAAWLFMITPLLFISTDSAVVSLIRSAAGFALGGGLFLLVYIVSRKGLGGGDVKFMAAAGLFLGPGGAVAAIFCGTLLAALTGAVLILLKKIGRKDSIPLAPFLFAGIVITVFLGTL